MPPRLIIRPPVSREEALAFGWVAMHALFPVAQPTFELVDAYVDRTGPSRMRLALRGREVIGGLVLLEMGQFFGGRAVPMTGVSAVAVAPEHRGSGVGRTLMTHALQAMAARRVAISGLYPATQPVYRRLGWEIAGVRQQWRLPARGLALGERSPPLRPMNAEDRQALIACHRQWARPRPGQLDRIDWGWRRVLESPDAEVRAHVVEAPDGRSLEGYVVATRQPGASIRSELHVRDLVALTGRAQRRLLSFLGDHRSIAPTVLAFLGPGDAPLLLPEEPERELVSDWRFMTRVVDLPKAMEARGFPKGLSAEAVVEIDDPDIPAQRGRFLIGCAGGQGHARPAGRRRAQARLHVRALAAAFTGHSSVEEMASAGLADGDADALATISALFAGPAPWTNDMW